MTTQRQTHFNEAREAYHASERKVLKAGVAYDRAREARDKAYEAYQATSQPADEEAHLSPAERVQRDWCVAQA